MKKNIALVLSSGGSKGLAHIGAINVLEKNGFQISSVSGSSIGSVIGGLYAMGELPAYTEWVKTLNKKKVWGLMDFALSTQGLLKGKTAFNKMKTFIPDQNIEDMNIPFSAIATDLINEKEVVFDKGSFYEAVRASVAIPTVFTPVKYKDTILVDGGVLNPVPIDNVKRSEDDLLVVVNLYGDKIEKDIQEKENSKSVTLINKFIKLIYSGDKRNSSYFSLLSETTATMVHRLAKLSIEKYQPDIVVNIPTDSANTFDFFRAGELIQLGEDATTLAINNYYINQKQND
ncbi:MAG: patatin-like phospholipase family protein [Bacteroidales bacterium]|nr:patatin-like phospholipase family protein [Bacteroidales bacterium]